MKITRVKNDFTGALGQEVEITSLEQLESFTREHAWSPYLFNRIDRIRENGEPYKLHRLNQNFNEGYFFAVDIDDGLSLEEGIKILKESGYMGFINTSRSHQISKEGGEPTDRFRIVFQLSRKITKASEVKGTFMKLKKLFPTMDDACKDPARFFKASKEKILIIPEGNLLVPEIFKEEKSIELKQGTGGEGFRLSKTSDEFLSKYWEEGNRHGPLVKACMNAGQQGWSKEAFKNLLNYSLNPWLKTSKHQACIDDIFDNKRWGNGMPTVYAEKQMKVSGSLQQKWVRIWLTKNKAAVSYDGSISLNGGPIMPISDILRKMRLTASRSNLIISNQHLEDEVTEFVEDMRHGQLDSIKTSLNKYNPTGLEELEKFMKKLGGSNYKTMDTIVMQHFIWNVKRRLNNMETYREIMPVIVGDQGIGKSYNLKNKFLQPLDSLMKSTSFQQLDDSRELKMLSNNFVLLFDEMSYANRSDVNNIKRLITEQTYSMRRMRETTHEVLAKNAQFIGTSNKSLNSNISDNTGMRRFFEIECEFLKNIEDITEFYSEFNDLDYEMMWHCVDHNKPSPIIEHIPTLTEIQDEYVTKHPIRQWLEDSGDVKVLEVDKQGDTAKDLLRRFNQWYGGKPFTSTSFGLHLTDRNFSDIIKSRSSKGIRYNLKLINHEGEYSEF